MWDLVVIGGGLSGVISAVSSVLAFRKLTRALRKSSKLRIALVSPELGGIPARGLVTPLGGAFSLSGKCLLTPLARSFINDLTELGEAITWEDPIGFTSKHITINTLSLGFRLEQILNNWGITYLKSRATKLRVIPKGIQIHLDSGIIKSKVVVDATGENLIARSLSLRLIEELPLPLSRIVLVKGVDYIKLLKWALNHPDEFYKGTRWDLLEDVLSGKSSNWAISGFTGILAEKPLPFPRDRIVAFSYFSPDEVLLNVTRVQGSWEGVYDSSLREESVKQVLALHDHLREYIPGFENSKIIAVGDLVSRDSPRTTETLKVLNEEDILKEADSEEIGKYPIAGWRVDIHRGKGLIEGEVPQDGFPIPLEIGILKDNPHLLLTGKNVSATSIPFSSLRVQGTLASLSEAIGILATLIALEGAGKSSSLENLILKTKEILANRYEEFSQKGFKGVLNLPFSHSADDI